MSAEEPTPRWELGRSFWPKIALSLVITVGFVILLQRGALKLRPTNEELLSVEGWSFAAYFAIFTVMHLLRCARWSLLLTPVQRVPLGTVIRVSLVGYLAIALLPFRMGEAARPLLIRRDAKVSAWAATGTVGAERLIDGLAAVSVVGAGINATYANLRTGSDTLTGAGIVPAGIATSSFRITWLIPRNRTDDAVRVLHQQVVEADKALLP